MKTFLVALMVVGAFALTGCGPKAEEAAPAGAAAQAGGMLTVELTANDQMKFSLSRIEASPGQEVKVIFTNIGSMPKVAMGHNWMLLAKGADPTAFVNAAVTAQATDYFPPAMADKVIAHTKLLGPKQTDEITFKAPTEPGEYTFLCSFPAHFVAGMKGVFVVR